MLSTLHLILLSKSFISLWYKLARNLFAILTPTPWILCALPLAPQFPLCIMTLSCTMIPLCALDLNHLCFCHHSRKCTYSRKWQHTSCITKKKDQLTILLSTKTPYVIFLCALFSLTCLEIFNQDFLIRMLCMWSFNANM